MKKIIPPITILVFSMMASTLLLAEEFSAKNLFVINCPFAPENFNSEDTILVELSEIICEGDTFDFYGNLISSSGYYEHFIENLTGPDTLVTLWLMTLPNPIFFGHATICQGDTIEILDELYYDQGVFSISYIDSNGCLLEGSVTIDWYVVDTSVVRQDERLVALATASSFQWYDCATDLLIPDADTRTFTPQEDGSYKVQVTDIHGCTAFSQCLEATLVSTTNPDGNIYWKITPNPVHDFLELNLQSPFNTFYNIKIVDMQGRIQFEKEFPIEDNYKINTTRLIPGAYIIRIKNDTGQSASRLFTKN